MVINIISYGSMITIYSMVTRSLVIMSRDFLQYGSRLVPRNDHLRSRFFVVLLIVVVLCGLVPAASAVASGVWDGSVNQTWYNDEVKAGHGSETNPFCIYDAESLAAFAQKVNEGTSFSGKYVRLCADLDLGSKNWQPIGGTDASPFCGTFDGDNHCITRLRVDLTNFENTVNAGLFGSALGGRIQNLDLDGVEISAYTKKNCRAGGLIGKALDVRIYSCSVTNGMVKAVSEEQAIFGGGLAGMVREDTLGHGSVENSYSTLTVEGERKGNYGYQITCGGLVGRSEVTTRNSFATGNVFIRDRSSSGAWVTCGGLVGRSDAKQNTTLVIFNCYATGTVTIDSPNDDNTWVGGLVGRVYIEQGNYVLKGCVALNPRLTATRASSLTQLKGRVTPVHTSTNPILDHNFAGRWMDARINGAPAEFNPAMMKKTGINGENVTQTQVYRNESFFRTVFSAASEYGASYDNNWMMSTDSSYPYPVLKGRPQPSVSGPALTRYYNVTLTTVDNGFTGTMTRTPDDPWGVMDGGDVTVTIHPDIRSRFFQLTDNDQDVTSQVIDNKTYVIPDLQTDHRLNVTFAAAPTYSVHITNGTLANGTTSGAFCAGENVTVTANAPPVGKKFSYWNVVSGSLSLSDADRTNSTLTFTMPQCNVTLEAVYADAVFTVTVTNGTLANGTTSGTFFAGENITVTADTPAVGTIFSSWNATGLVLDPTQRGQSPLTFTMPAQNVTLDATYSPDTQYAVSVHGGVLSTGASDGMYFPGENVTVTANAPPVGKKFSYWNVVSGSLSLSDADRTNSTLTFAMPRGDVVIEAIYEESAKFTVTVTNGTLSNGTTSGAFYVGQSVQVTANTIVGKTFSSWDVKGLTLNDTQRTQSPLTFTMPNGTVILSALYTDAPTVTVTPTSSSTVTVTPTPSSNVTVTPTSSVPPTGTVTPSVTRTSAGISSSGDGNMNNAFRVLFDTQDGTFIPPQTYLSYGDVVTRPPSPEKNGYIFAGWYQDPDCTKRWNFAAPIPGDLILYAKWVNTPTSTATETSTTKVTEKLTVTKTQTPALTTMPTSIQSTRPTLKQAPFPLVGILAGLVAAGILVRRRT